MIRFAQLCACAAAAVLLVATGRPAVGQNYTTSVPSMLTALDGWESTPLLTIGESLGDYTPPGIPDGMGALKLGGDSVRLFVTHEIRDEQGYVYRLANGTPLTGARISYLDVDRKSRVVTGGGLAFHTIIDRNGDVVTHAEQINEWYAPEGEDESLIGIDRLCSANLFERGEYGLVDDIFFAGEETGNGQEFALDVRGGVLYAVPWMGRAAWESVTMIDTGDPETVGFIIGDDRAPAPLLLYVGQKDQLGDGSFLDRNGLARGVLYTWVADDGASDPREFHGTRSSRAGHFAKIEHYRPGAPGYDAQGFATQATQDALVAAAGGFLFSRPEDVATSPRNRRRVVMASTGSGGLFDGVDDWGTTYVIDIERGRRGAPIRATVRIVYDGDDAGGGAFSDPDFGLRSPDNLEWAGNGRIYVQEDRATRIHTFGAVSREEASIWELGPVDGSLRRIAQVDRAVIPEGQSESEGSANDLGNWETSGAVDVTEPFQAREGERLLLANVQAHGIRGGDIESLGLVQGGQIVLLSKRERGPARFAAPAHSQRIALTAYPSPFNPSTTLSFGMREAGVATITVHDVLGRELRVLVDELYGPGTHRVQFHASSLASGTYLVRMRVGADVVTKPIILLN